jgi:CRP-like cAMP-binding protein
MAVFQRRLATPPLATYQAGETVLGAASTTGRLLILKEGAGAVVKEGVEIARVTEPGAVFGELSVLLDQPHTADVRALEASQFHVADAATILRVDPTSRLHGRSVQRGVQPERGTCDRVLRSAQNSYHLKGRGYQPSHHGVREGWIINA